MNKKYDIIPQLFWVGLSIFCMAGAYKLELGDFREPGAGLIPFLLGAILFVISVPLVVKSLFGSRSSQEVVRKESPENINFTKVASVAASLFLYCLLLKKLGYLTTTTLLFIFLFKTSSPRSWIFVIIGSLLTAVVTYLGFTLLGLRFPRGILGV
jgi:putative tricarboxylic transport membrane protein